MSRTRFIRPVLFAAALMLPFAAPTPSQATESLEDATITQQVMSALGSYNKMITIRTENGKVRLGGVITDDNQRDEILRLTRGVAGVKAIQDDISYSPESHSRPRGR